MDETWQDPDLEFGLLLAHTVMPELLYEDEVLIYRVLDDIYTIESDGTDDQILIATAIIMEQYPEGIKYEPWCSTRINEHKYITTLVVT